MLERWRQPAGVIAIEEQEHEGIWLPDGRVQGNVRLVVDGETIERMRLGYMCVKCLEPFEVAWPERCPICGAPIRDKQAEFFAEEFGGKEPIKGFSLADERERMHEQIEREARDE